MKLRRGAGCVHLPYFWQSPVFYNRFEELKTVLFKVDPIINNTPLIYVYTNTIETCLTPNHLLFDRQLLYFSNTTSTVATNLTVLSSTTDKLNRISNLFKDRWHCIKRVRIQSYSGPHFSLIFPHFDWIQRDTSYLSIFSPNAGKMQTRITANADTFYAVWGYKYEVNSRETQRTSRLYLKRWKDAQKLLENCHKQGYWLVEILRSSSENCKDQYISQKFRN